LAAGLTGESLSEPLLSSESLSESLLSESLLSESLESSESSLSLESLPDDDDEPELSRGFDFAEACALLDTGFDAALGFTRGAATTLAIGLRAANMAARDA
jgi:hypothetical protein